MKNRVLISFVISLLLLSFSSVALANSTSIEEVTKQAHSKIVTDNNLDLNEWIQFDISDIPEVAKGTFPGINKEIGKKFLKAYFTGGIQEKYHKIGDSKPLFLIHKNLDNAMFGFLHSDKKTTLIKLDLATAEPISSINSTSSFSVTGKCNVLRPLLESVGVDGTVLLKPFPFFLSVYPRFLHNPSIQS